MIHVSNQLLSLTFDLPFNKKSDKHPIDGVTATCNER